MSFKEVRTVRTVSQFRVTQFSGEEFLGFVTR